uniref:Innexin n=1 Tax=Schmidtea mediterranea TaxID=79327 RepID=A7RDN9_SCHMD|nr:smedxin-11 [Schmidtea mediterranea]
MITDIFTLFPLTDHRVDLQDLADKMSSTVTVAILFIFSSLIAYKTYFISPMECLASDAPKVLNFENYMTSFCWVNGIVPLGPDELMPNDRNWNIAKTKSINYYPWIPIILGIQCLFFYLPKLYWQEYCSYKGGTDLHNLIDLSKTASKAPIESRSNSVKDIATMVENLFHLHRDNQHGRISELKRKMFKRVPLLVWGKRSGNGILGVYMLMKLMYIAISVFQLYFMKKVLQLDNKFWSIFHQVFQHIFYGSDWNSTKYFPRVGYCKVTLRSLGNMGNSHITQCVLPINILNEKIYIFLFLWIWLLIVLSIVYLLNWIYIICFRCPKQNMIKLYLKGKNVLTKLEEPIIDKFITEFIRLDGIFLLKMIRINAGDVLTACVVENLWSIYKAKYRYIDFSNTECLDQKENLALRLEPGDPKISIKSKIQPPSAPTKDMFL